MEMREEKMRRRNQNGSAHIGVIVVVILVLVGVGFVFWRVQNEATDSGTNTTETNQPQETVTDDPIENEADLDEATTELEQTDIDSELDVSEIDEVIQ